VIRRALLAASLLAPLSAGAVRFEPCEYDTIFYVNDGAPESKVGQVARSSDGNTSLTTLLVLDSLDIGIAHPIREGWYTIDIQAVHDGSTEFNATDGDSLTLCVSRVTTGLVATATDACIVLEYGTTNAVIEETYAYVLLSEPLWSFELEAVSDIGGAGSPDIIGTFRVRLRKHTCE